MDWYPWSDWMLHRCRKSKYNGCFHRKNKTGRRDTLAKTNCSGLELIRTMVWINFTFLMFGEI